MAEAVRIGEVVTDGDTDVARELFREYGASLGFDLCFQGFEKELAQLPGKYAPPDGCILLAWMGASPAGCAALRELEDGKCEMKRLYVRPRFRGAGIGRELAEAIILRARNAGYAAVRLDTLASMKPAIGLYLGMGFREIAPYYENPIEGARYLELCLS